jgi:hypothetical protein
MNNPRDVAVVCEQILNIIPNSEIELRNELREFHDSLWNKAPEIRRGSELWKPFGNILSSNIHVIDEDWKQQILKVFNNQ